MEPLLFVMAIMGCSDGGIGCSEQRLVETRYASMSACQAAVENQLYANSDISFPTLMASCRPIGNRYAAAKAGPNG